MPVILLCVIIFVVWLHYETTKASKVDKEKSESFWNREREANTTRKVDISHLEYITIPLDTLPFQETEDVTLKSLQDKTKELSNEKIVNLTGLSNTDLKLKYGASNLTNLSNYDQNYTVLVRTLNAWGTYLYEHNCMQEAKIVLEFAVKCHSDIKNTYVLLATIYVSLETRGKIHELLDIAQNLNSLSKNSILDALKSML